MESKEIRLNDVVVVNNKQYVVDDTDFEDNFYLRPVTDDEKMEISVTRNDISNNITLNNNYIRKLKQYLEGHMHNCVEFSEPLIEELEKLKTALENENVGCGINNTFNKLYEELHEPLNKLYNFSNFLYDILKQV